MLLLAEFIRRYENSNKYELYFHDQLSDTEFGGEISTKFSNCNLIKAAFREAKDLDITCVVDCGNSFVYYELTPDGAVEVKTR